jgi:hypothetical protein
MCAAALGLAGILLLIPVDSQAMPSFARQTGMNCNSCHIGTDNVPNFTRTGRIFAMRGYVRPTVRERFARQRAIEDMPQYGGDSSRSTGTTSSPRLISELVQGGRQQRHEAGHDLRPLARMAFFYGPITDWLASGRRSATWATTRSTR